MQRHTPFILNNSKQTKAIFISLSIIRLREIQILGYHIYKGYNKRCRKEFEKEARLMRIIN